MTNTNNNANKKSIYILLTKTNTLFSSLVQNTTNASYTHAAIGLDRNFTRLYSFSRLFSPIPFICGLMQENIHSGVYARDGSIPAAVYELELDLDIYEAVEYRISEMLDERYRYRYNILGLAYNYLGQPHSRPYHYFCSEFVMDTLIQTSAITTDRRPCSVRPADFTSMPGLRLIYAGALENSDALGFQRRTSLQRMPFHVFTS